jgi:hypothetical protein
MLVRVDDRQLGHASFKPRLGVWSRCAIAPSATPSACCARPTPLAKDNKAVEEGHELIFIRRGRPVARLTREHGTDRTKDPKASSLRMLHLIETAVGAVA